MEKTREEIISIIRNAYVESLIHADLDASINFGGNGVCGCEALSVLRGLAKQIGVTTEPPTTSEIQKLDEDEYYKFLAKESGYSSLGEVYTIQD